MTGASDEPRLDGRGWGMGLVWLLGAVVLVLVIVALVKYVFFR